MKRCHIMWCIAVIFGSACTPSAVPNPKGSDPDRVTPASARPPVFFEPSEEHEEDARPDLIDSRVSPEMTWFKGVSNLPPGHPCGNDAKIVEDPCVDPECEHESPLITTLGHERRTKTVYEGNYHPHFGPRLVKGVSWVSDDGEHVLTSCRMIGRGIHRLVEPLPGEDQWSGWRWERANIDTESAAFAIEEKESWWEGGYNYASYIEMHRPRGSSQWHIAFEHGIEDWDDGENPPPAFAWSEILDVGDLDSDGDIESASFGLRYCKEHIKATHEAFLLVRDGGREVRGVVKLDCKGRIIEESLPDGEEAEWLDSVRADFLRRARAIVRQDCGPNQESE